MKVSMKAEIADSDLEAAAQQQELEQPHRPVVAWWRLKPAIWFDAAALSSMRHALSQIDMLGEPRWKQAAAGDASAAIGIALGMRSARPLKMQYDLVMTALAACAAQGDPAACTTMSHLLRRLPDASDGEVRIANSWLAWAFSSAIFSRPAGSGSHRP